MNAHPSPGCVILLLDESAGMAAVMGDVVADGSRSTKTNAERVATAVNALLAQLAPNPDFDLALVGYRADESAARVGSRFAGDLAGRDFVRVSELAAHPLRVETRTRKVPAPGGLGITRDESVSFPLWYEHAASGKAVQIAAWDHCHRLLAQWAATADPGAGRPLVIHLFSGATGDGNPEMVIRKVSEVSTPGGTPIVMQVHLAQSAQLVSAAYPSSHVYLTLGSSRDWFRRASPLPTHLIAALKDAKLAVNPNARGLLYNAKIADVIRALGVIKAHAKTFPSAASHTLEPPAVAAATTVVAAATTVVATATPVVATAVATSPPAVLTSSGTAEPPSFTFAFSASEPLDPLPPLETADAGFMAPVVAQSRERAALVVLVLDRSVADPFSGDMKNPCARLQDQANDVLRQVGKLADLAVDAAIVSYGLDGAGQLDVRGGFDGPLSGQTIVARADLAAGPIRVEEYDEEVSNGIGGLVSVHRTKPIYFELEPTAAASPVEAFVAAADVVRQWTARHAQAALSPIVLHLTRGQPFGEEMRRSASLLADVAGPQGPSSLYHLVLTETPHPSLAYPEGDAGCETSELKLLFELSSPLLGRSRLAGEKPGVTASSRGLVVNGKFDLLLDEVKFALQP